MIAEYPSTQEGLNRILRSLDCPHCGRPLIQSASGAVCEDWNCGGIQWYGHAQDFARTKKKAEELAAWLSLPEATYKRTGFGEGHYEISGRQDKWRKLKEARPGSLMCRRRPSESDSMPVQHFIRID